MRGYPDRVTGPEAEKLWTKTDTALAVKLLAAAPFAWLVPRRLWPRIARNAVQHGLVSTARLGETQRIIRGFIGDRLGAAEIEATSRELHALKSLLELQSLRALWPSVAQPSTRLVGLEHIRAAETAGCGVVLWILPTVFASLFGKLAMHRGGLAVHHLSRFTHPYTPSRLGARLLNPLRYIPETRWLAARVTIERGRRPTAAMCSLARAVTAGGIVSITVGAEGDAPVRLPLLDGWIHLASGASRLAARTGAALLPVVTISEGDGFATTIHPPIEMAEDLVPMLETTALHHTSELYWHDTMFQ